MLSGPQRVFFKAVPTATLGVLVVVFTLACGGAARVATAPASGVASDPVSELLLAELRRRAAAYPAPDSTNTVFSSMASQAVPGLVYHWGEYFPRRTIHVRFSAVVGVRERAHVLVDDVQDWLEAAGSFTASAEEQALRVCAELIHTTTRPRAPDLPPLLYLGPQSLRNLARPVPDSQILRDSLSGPEIRREAASGWLVKAWAVERTDVRRYQCRIGLPDFGLSVLDSLPGYGYYGS